jgi:curli biogenesis system outer membrane secretion channel CsgG
MTLRSPCTAALLCAGFLLTGCTADGGFAFTSTRQSMVLPKGPPIEDMVTPFDEALTCVRSKIEPAISFAVGQVIDATGKETYSDGGSGKMLSQGAGEMVQTALFRAGVTVVNRRDPNIPIVETQWGIRDIKQLTPANFYVSGSINSLDFIPGGGVEVDVAGIGARFRQTRILIALDLSLTDAFTGRIVANVPLQKQIFAQEMGAGADRFFGSTLISLSAGGMEREAVHFAMRQMLNFATLELLGQIIPRDRYLPCKALVSPVDGQTSDVSGAPPSNSGMGEALAAVLERNSEMPVEEVKVAQPAQRATMQPAIVSPEARKAAQTATSFAGQAMAAAEAAKKSRTADEASGFAAEATQFLAVAIQYLRSGAALGLAGPEGDASAMLVEQAVLAVQEAQQNVRRLEGAEGTNDATPNQPAGTGPTDPSVSPPVFPDPIARDRIEGSLEDQKKGIVED